MPAAGCDGVSFHARGGAVASACTLCPASPRTRDSDPTVAALATSTHLDQRRTGRDDWKRREQSEADGETFP